MTRPKRLNTRPFLLLSYFTFFSFPFIIALHFFRYDDLKPPSSPTPSAPTTAPVDSGSQDATLSVNSTAQSLIADKPSDEQHNAKTKPRPLSPFTM
ncbi:hypothetical protein CRYUN_Cryun18bG0089000 [Craigia yunnanensis]